MHPIIFYYVSKSSSCNQYNYLIAVNHVSLYIIAKIIAWSYCYALCHCGNQCYYLTLSITEINAHYYFSMHAIIFPYFSKWSSCNQCNYLIVVNHHWNQCRIILLWIMSLRKSMLLLNSFNHRNECTLLFFIMALNQLIVIKTTTWLQSCIWPEKWLTRSKM
jgi:hypothetical protein